jgi:hypothetical protein
MKFFSFHDDQAKTRHCSACCHSRGLAPGAAPSGFRIGLCALHEIAFVGNRSNQSDVSYRDSFWAWDDSLQATNGDTSCRNHSVWLRHTWM